LLVAVAVSLVSAILPWSLVFNPVSVSGEGMVSLETNAALTTNVDMFSMVSESTSEENIIKIPEDAGYLWRNPYMRIYSFGETLRCLEIST
jgi:hypothetical protein